jgi:hypothetical protein
MSQSGAKAGQGGARELHWCVRCRGDRAVGRGPALADGAGLLGGGHAPVFPGRAPGVSRAHGRARDGSAPRLPVQRDRSRTSSRARRSNSTLKCVEHVPFDPNVPKPPRDEDGPCPSSWMDHFSNKFACEFAGSDKGAERLAVGYTIFGSCRMHGVNPLAWATDVISKLQAGWPRSRLDELLPECRPVVGTYGDQPRRRAPLVRCARSRRPALAVDCGCGRYPGQRAHHAEGTSVDEVGGDPRPSARRCSPCGAAIGLRSARTRLTSSPTSSFDGAGASQWQRRNPRAMSPQAR